MIGAFVIVAGGLFGWYYFTGKSVIPTQQTSGSTFLEETTVPTVEVGQPQNASSAGNETGIVGTEKGGVVSGTTVAFTDTGFVPVKITVKKGTTVTFVNQSSGGMWVASDVHPTHQLLFGFDEKKSSANGSSYSYTFVKVGTWTYHNHMQPTQTGSVIVTE